MTILCRGLIFQPVLASLPYTQTCTYKSDTIITLQNILTLQEEEGGGGGRGGGEGLGGRRRRRRWKRRRFN